MSNTRLPMRKIREALRLKHESGLRNREIALSLGLSHTSVADYLYRAEASGIGWPLPEGLGDQELENRLFPPASSPASSNRPLPDFAAIRKELQDYKKLNLTLTQLWIEYKLQHPNGYQYTQFCELYNRWLGKLDYCMRQDHKAGEKLFVDYADGLSIVHPTTGEFTATQLFVAVWGASNYTYAEASLTQELPFWVGSHVRAFEYFGCVPHLLVPDCLKSGVTQACFYEPHLNQTYADMATHYHSAVLPARPGHPRDKAKVEGGVLIAKRWILSVLRKRIFYSLSELNAAISELLESLNTRALKKIKKSRREIFLEVDRPAALGLPATPYEYAEWKKATVNLDYHIAVHDHYYSVPFQLLREKLDVRLTAATLEAFHKGARVAAHARSYSPHTHTTLPGHMPPDHKRYLEWSPSRILQWAGKTGPATQNLVEKIIASRDHPEQGYRSALGILRLGKNFGPERLESASVRALSFHAFSYRAVRSILEQGLDRQTNSGATTGKTSLPLHDNVRGKQVYH